jgi:hypothetical protein
MSSFLLHTDRNGKLIFVLRVFALRAVLEEQIKLKNQGISVQVKLTKNKFYSHSTTN